MLLNYELPLERLYHISDWLLNLIIINILWLIFNLPIFYIILLLYSASDIENFVSILIILFGLSPFIFFPATHTMFVIIRRLIFEQGQTKKIIRKYFKNYLKNYLQNIIKGLILTFIWVIFIVDYYFFVSKMSNIFSYIFLFLLVFLLTFSINYFSVSVHFKSTYFQEIKNALFVTLSNPFLTLGIGVFSILAIYLSFNYLTFLIPLVLGSFIAFISFACVNELIFKKVTQEV